VLPSFSGHLLAHLLLQSPEEEKISGIDTDCYKEYFALLDTHKPLSWHWVVTFCAYYSHT
jgi:hypothetical protein